MLMPLRFSVLVIPIAMLAFFPGTARADLQFNLSTVINGSAPSGATPWLTADFHTNSVGDVTLTMRNLMPAAEFVDDWVFNVDVDPFTLTATQTSGPPTSTLVRSHTQSLNGGSNMKAGFFNLDFTWPTSNSADRFDGGNTVVWQFLGGGITENSFNLASLPDPHGFETDLTAAHVQGIPGVNGTLSGSIRGAPPTVVPEVSSIFLLLGVAGLLAPAFRRKWAR